VSHRVASEPGPDGAGGDPRPAAAGVVPGPEEVPATYEAARPGPDPTVGTGSLFAVGCVIVLMVVVAALAAIFFLPHLRG
jgi:hypothetical protein